MPRRPRREESGLIHHATMRGVDGEFIFHGAEDRAGYLAMLVATVKCYGWLCLAYCLMGTHLHLLVETPEPNFGEGMQWLHGQYGRCFNKQYPREGHLYQGRYHDEPVETDDHLINAVGYIATNPVTAGLCRDPSEWPWSSHASVVGTIGRKPWLAHGRLVKYLDGIAGPNAYEQLIATRVRAIDAFVTAGSDPLDAARY